MVATAGLTPLKRSQKAVDYVADTDDLRPIAVQGNDEIAQLTSSFNAMLGRCRSRARASRNWWPTPVTSSRPLTSMRTNIELLMMLNQPGAADRISAADRQDLSVTSWPR